MPDILTQTDNDLLQSIATSDTRKFSRQRVMQLLGVAQRQRQELRAVRCLMAAATGLVSKEEIVAKPNLSDEVRAQCLELHQQFEDAQAWRAQQEEDRLNELDNDDTIARELHHQHLIDTGNDK